MEKTAELIKKNKQEYLENSNGYKTSEGVLINKAKTIERVLSR